MIKKDKNFIHNFLINRKKFRIVTTSILVLAMLGVSFVGLRNENINGTIVNTNASTLSNKKIGWGLKRAKNGEQPDVGSLNKKLLGEVNGIYMGNKNDKYIYLTFDMGYEAGYTDKILDVLKEENVKATFFITGHYLNSASDTVKRMIDEGHIVGNHTVNHKCMPEISDEANKEELNTLNQMMYEKFGYEMKYMRPPEGEYSQRTLAITENLGYKTVLWSFAYLDYDDKNPPTNKEATNKIMENIHNGEIMLLHGTSKVNMEILKDVIEQIKSNGYEFKSLDEFKE